MTDLPKGWAKTTLGEVCKVVGGSTPSTKVPGYWNGAIPWITPDDLSRHTDKTISHGARSITEAGYESCSTHLLPAGSVLFSSRAPIGYVAIAANSVCTNQGFKSFVPCDGLSSSYLFWYLRFATPAIRAMGSGTTFAELSGKRARTIPIVVPPAAEQRRIVEAIEEEFSRLDAADASLAAANHRLLLLRRTAVARAIPTEPLVGMEDLADRSKHALAIGPFGSNLKVSDYRDSGVPLVFVRDIRRRTFGGPTTRFITEAKANELRPHWVRPGDVLVTKMGDPPGDAAVYPDREPAVITADCIKITPAPTVDPGFLAMTINSPLARQQVLGITAGVAQRKVSLARFRDQVRLPMPPLEEQRRVVAEVERQLSLVESMEAAVGRALARSAQLRRAVFERAFSGRLVPQDPTDEPASALLARIASERVGSRKS